MNCPECGAELPDDSVYCSACGVRVDGKTECVKCGRLIDNKNVYCNYCGARQDGQDDYSYGEAGVCGHKADSRENGENRLPKSQKRTQPRTENLLSVTMKPIRVKTSGEFLLRRTRYYTKLK